MPNQHINIGGDTRAMLGELFLKAGLISIDQLCHALYVAHKNCLPLGRVLVMLGMVKTRVLEGALNLQNLVRQNLMQVQLAINVLHQFANGRARLVEVLQECGWTGNVARDEGNIGEILIEAKILTRKSIDDALGLSRHVGLPLSRILVLQGMISPRLLVATVKAQEVIRSGRVQKDEAIRALSSAASMLEFEKACEKHLETRQPFIKLEELLLLARLMNETDLQRFEAERDHFGGGTLGEYIVESSVFSAAVIAAAVRLQTMIARMELSPLMAAMALRLIYSKDLTLMQAIRESYLEKPPYDGDISLYHLLRLSGLITAFDVRRLGHLPVSVTASGEAVEDRLLKAGIMNKATMEAAKRCHLLMKEGFLTTEQAMIVLQHWSWSGEGLTRVLEKLQWGTGRIQTLNPVAFRV